MESPDFGGQPTRVGHRFAFALDLWVIAAWWLFIVAFGFSHADYAGDGLRHLPAIIEGTGPPLGEPRWLLFPGFLYLLLRPFVLLGANDVLSLARVMLGAIVLAAGAYMLALRQCLVAARIEPRHRAAALALAGSTAGLLFQASNLMEPIIGAAIVMCALAWAAGRAAAPAATDADRRLALLVAVGGVAVGALVYQGLLLGLGLIPLCVPLPRETFRDRRTQILALAILAVVPVVMVGALVLAGNSVGHAVQRALQGEENQLYSGYMKKPGVLARIVPLVAGPQQGLVEIGTFRGFNGLIASLRGGDGRADAVQTVVVLVAAGGLILAGLVAAIRRRDVALLIAFGALMLLPVVRCQQYGYIKFYIFLAVVAAFAAAHARPAVVAVVAILLFLVNVAPSLAAVPAERRAFREHAAVYAQAGPRSCWMASGWIPPYSFQWPGSVCPVLGALASGHGEVEAQVIASAHAAMTSCLEECFCRSTGAYMDDMMEAGPFVAETATRFHYADFDLRELVLPAARAERLTPAGAVTPIYRYPSADQRRICDALTRAKQMSAPMPASP